MSPPWWAAFPPVEARIDCGAGRHRLRWAEGRLIAADHPDAEGELILAALGGDKAECVTLAGAWGAHRDDLDVLALGPRSAADELTITWESLKELRSPPQQGVWLGYAPPGQPPLPRGVASQGQFSVAAPRRFPRQPGDAETKRAWISQQELLSLFALGPGFQQRLSGAVAAAWSPDGSRASDRARARPALVAALTGRVAPAASAWLGIDADQVTASLHEGPGWGSLQLTGTGPDSRLTASLPPGWLARVWAPGLAVLGDHLVVDVLDVTWPDARLLGLRRPGAEPVALSARHYRGDWSVRREEQI
jgi:hypothetical protein